MCCTFSEQVIKVGSLIDNINIDPVTGNQWLAAFPQALHIVEYTKNISHLCPSQILTLQLGEPSASGIAYPDYELREVYVNDGKEVSAATVATVYKDRLLIGSLSGDMLYCEVKFY